MFSEHVQTDTSIHCVNKLILRNCSAVIFEIRCVMLRAKKKHHGFAYYSAVCIKILSEIIWASR